MGEKDHSTNSNSGAVDSTTNLANNAKTENEQQDDFEEKLARLPDMHRTEILRQYEIPDT